MSIIVNDNGTDKEVSAVYAQESGTDKEVQEVIVNDGGTDKSVYTALPGLPDSFESWSDGLPNGWYLDADATNDQIEEYTDWSYDGDKSIYVSDKDTPDDHTTVIEREVDLTGISSLKINYKGISSNKQSMGNYHQFQALDSDRNKIDSKSDSTGSGDGSFTLDVSSYDGEGYLFIELGKSDPYQEEGEYAYDYIREV